MSRAQGGVTGRSQGHLNYYLGTRKGATGEAHGVIRAISTGRMGGYTNLRLRVLGHSTYYHMSTGKIHIPTTYTTEVRPRGREWKAMSYYKAWTESQRRVSSTSEAEETLTLSDEELLLVLLCQYDQSSLDSDLH